jgi:hypothetical protein
LAAFFEAARWAHRAVAFLKAKNIRVRAPVFPEGYQA